MIRVGTNKDQLGKKRSYDVPKPINFADYIHPCCGVFQVQSWGNTHPDCDMVIRSYHQHQLEMFCKTCRYCGRQFSSPLQYLQHQDSIYYSIRAIICSLCRGVYLSEAMLAFHISDCHREPKSIKQTLSVKYTNI